MPKHPRCFRAAINKQPAHIKALLSEYAWDTYVNNATEIRYNTVFPQHVLANPPSWWSIPAYVALPLISAESDRDLIREAFEKWAKIANIRFIEDVDKYQLPIFKFMPQSIFSVPSGYGDYPRTTWSSGGIGLNYLKENINHYTVQQGLFHRL